MTNALTARTLRNTDEQFFASCVNGALILLVLTRQDIDNGSQGSLGLRNALINLGDLDVRVLDCLVHPITDEAPEDIERRIAEVSERFAPALGAFQSVRELILAAHGVTSPLDLDNDRLSKAHVKLVAEVVQTAIAAVENIGKTVLDEIRDFSA